MSIIVRVSHPVPDPQSASGMRFESFAEFTIPFTELPAAMTYRQLIEQPAREGEDARTNRGLQLDFTSTQQ